MTMLMDISGYKKWPIIVNDWWFTPCQVRIKKDKNRFASWCATILTHHGGGMPLFLNQGLTNPRSPGPKKIRSLNSKMVQKWLALSNHIQPLGTAKARIFGGNTMVIQQATTSATNVTHRNPALIELGLSLFPTSVRSFAHKDRSMPWGSAWSSHRQLRALRVATIVQDDFETEPWLPCSVAQLPGPDLLGLQQLQHSSRSPTSTALDPSAPPKAHGHHGGSPGTATSSAGQPPRSHLPISGAPPQLPAVPG